MVKQHRIVIIGVGGIANMHANAVKDLSDRATLLAGSCRHEEKGRVFAERFQCRWHADYERMLDEENPDVAMICTPSGFHLEPTLACARRGISVLCEKPLEITTHRVDRMIEAARQAGIHLGGIFPSRFNPVLGVVREAARQGRFGNLAFAGTWVPWWREDKYYSPDRWQGKLALDGGGALMNQSIHGIDALQWIVSATMPELRPEENPVTEVFAYCGKRGHDPKLIEVEDTAVAVLRFRNGALGQILGATSMWPGSDRRFMMAGRNGTADVHEKQLVIFKFRDEQPQDADYLARFSAAPESDGASDPLAIGHAGHTANLLAFLDAIDNGQTPDIDGVQSRKAVAIITAIYESATTGRPAKVS